MLRLTMTAMQRPKIDRIYTLTISRDLFGMLMVEARFGRNNRTKGQVWRQTSPTLEDAMAIVRPRLLRRLTARKRLGVSYKLVEVDDPLGLCYGKNAPLEGLIERLK